MTLENPNDIDHTAEEIGLSMQYVEYLERYRDNFTLLDNPVPMSYKTWKLLHNSFIRPLEKLKKFLIR
jgi:hypothetical protein